MALPKAYRSFADFERDEIRPNLRAGWSMDDLRNPHDRELDFELDPFEAALQAAEAEEEEEEDDDD